MSNKHSRKLKFFRFFSMAALILSIFLTGCQRNQKEPSIVSDSGSQKSIHAISGTYQEDEALQIMQRTYGTQVLLVRYQEPLFTFRQEISQPTEGSFLFQAENNSSLTDNYRQELLHYLGDVFFSGKNRSFHWEESGSGIHKTYTPVISCNSRSGEELNWFCNDICDFIEYCQRNDAFTDGQEIFSSLSVTLGAETASFTPPTASYNRTEFYNALYEFLDDFTLLAMNQIFENQANSSASADLDSIPLETLDFYLNAEFSCSFRFKNGMEYRMTATDRALGSSYYILIGTSDNGKTCSFLNTDPYNGSGGEAKWLTFLDENLGFSCLAYNGGSYGSLYRTENGGVTFQEVEYPSPKALLSDGTYYNPFVMPDKVYEKDGLLYLVAGQGPNGDYYSSAGHCSGLYSSEDLGKTWVYVGEIPENEIP